MESGDSDTVGSRSAGRCHGGIVTGGEWTTGTAPASTFSRGGNGKRAARQALAALRNAVAALLRIEGWTTLPAGFRYCRESSQHTLQLLGVPAT